MKLKYKIWIGLCSILLMGSLARGQSVNVSNARMTIPAGTAVTLGGSVILLNGGGIINSGTIDLKGDWLNYAQGLMNGAQGTTIFSGSNSQSAMGISTSFFNLQLNNSQGLNLGSNQIVAGTLSFLNGKINTGSYQLQLTATMPSAIVGAGSSKYVNGNLRVSFPTGNHLFKFEIGKEVYAPLTLTLNNVTTAGSIAAATSAGPSPNENFPVANAANIFQPNRVNQHWTTTNNGLGFSSASVRLDFTNTTNTGTVSNYVVRKFNPPFSWTAPSSIITGTTIQANALPSLTSEYVVGEPVITILNNNPSNAQVVSLSGNSYPNCGVLQGDVSQATASSEDGVFSGADVWYQFVATSNACRITMTSSIIDCALALYQFNGSTYTLLPTSASGLGSTENLTGVGGTEILNYDGLVMGNTYFLAAGAASSSSPLGPFSVCIQRFNPPTCADGSGTYELCSNFKPTFSAATSYTFTFTGTGTTPVGPTSGTSTSQIPLSNANLALQYGGTYSVGISAFYNLTNGLGNIETMTVSSNNACNITIAGHPNVVTKPQQICPATILRSTLLNGKPFVCSAISFTVSFRQVNQCSTGSGFQYMAPSAFEVTTQGASSYLALNFTTPQQLSNQSFYEVRWRPNFTYGPGTFGPPSIIFIGGPVLEGNDESETVMPAILFEEKNSVIQQLNGILYPNPNKGDQCVIEIKNHSNSSASEFEPVLISIYDAFGKVVFSRTYVLNESSQIFLNFESPLVEGIYVVEYLIGSEIINEKMMVIR